MLMFPFFETIRFFNRSWWGSMLKNFLPEWMMRIGNYVDGGNDYDNDDDDDE